MSIFDGQFKISVSTASGIEAITKRELYRLGYGDIPAIGGRLVFDGNMKDVAVLNLNLRTANRVRIVVAKFKAETFDELFDGVYSVRWQDVLLSDSRIVVTAKSVKSKLFALSSIQSITKKAIVKKMQDALRLKTLPESGEEYRFEVSICEDEVTIGLDTSGDGLHKRGYRTKVWIAPMRETMAAAIILNSYFKADRALIDPFCGSGTFPIEAALIATNTPSGMLRNFAFEKFSNAPKVMPQVKDEYESKIIQNADLRISGFDIDGRAIKLANEHAKNAGVKDYIHFETKDMRNISSRYAHGIMVANPPYGERLSGGSELKELYRDFGKMFKSLDEWSCYVVTTVMSFEKYFGRKADKTRKLYNSELECRLFSFLGAPPRKRNENSSTES